MQTWVNEPDWIQGHVGTLWDRLRDDSEKTVASPKRLMTQRETLDSIQDELTAIFGTRACASAALYASAPSQSPGDFGVPSLFGIRDFQSWDAANPRDWPKIESICKRAITAFETRLHSPHVKVARFHPMTQSLELVVSAHITWERRLTPATFPISLMAA
jgi:type VI secretion system lysozyme-like protein